MCEADVASCTVGRKRRFRTSEALGKPVATDPRQGVCVCVRVRACVCVCVLCLNASRGFGLDPVSPDELMGKVLHVVPRRMHIERYLRCVGVRVYEGA